MIFLVIIITLKLNYQKTHLRTARSVTKLPIC